MKDNNLLMLVLKRVGNVQCMTQKLRKVMRSREQVKLADNVSSAHSDTIIKLIRRTKRNEWSKSKSDSELSQLHELRERLLFRTAPVSLSLLERELHSLSLRHSMQHTHNKYQVKNFRAINKNNKDVNTAIVPSERQQEENCLGFTPSKLKTASEEVVESNSKRECEEGKVGDFQREINMSTTELSPEQTFLEESTPMHNEKIQSSKEMKNHHQQHHHHNIQQKGQEETFFEQPCELTSMSSNQESNSFAVVQHVVAQRLLSSLLYFEQERRVLLKERQEKQLIECDKHKRHLQHVQRQLSIVKQRARKNSMRYAAANKMLHNQELNEWKIQIERLENEVNRARSQLDEAKTTMQLLENSLIARPYLSAKMWQFLLRREVWAPLLLPSCNMQTVNKHNNNIKGRTNAIDAVLGPSASRSSKSQTKSLSVNSKCVSSMHEGQTDQTTQLIKMSFALSHIVLGVLSDYIRGGELNVASPRFVVSFPSKRYIQQHVQQVTENKTRKDRNVVEAQEHTITGKDSKLEAKLNTINNSSIVSNDTSSGTANGGVNTCNINTNIIDCAENYNNNNVGSSSSCSNDDHDNNPNDLLFDMLQCAQMEEADVKMKGKSTLLSVTVDNNNPIKEDQTNQEPLHVIQHNKGKKHRKITKYRRTSKKNHSVLSWLPSHSANVLPLVVHTLALHSFLLSEVEVDTVGVIRHLPLLLNTLVTLQKTATLTLTLLKDNNDLPITNINKNKSCTNSAMVTSVENKLASKMQRAQISFTSLHSVLHKLEDTLVNVGKKIKTQLHSALVCVNAQRGAAFGTPALQLSPQAAAEIILQLNSLHLLPMRSRSSAELLAALLVCMFPQLRTNTENALTERTRKTGLLAFATQKHRRSLMYKLHSHIEAEDYLHNTTIQQARLRQRAMMAALRERYLTQIHIRTTTSVGKLLPPADLLTLLEIVITRACQTEAFHSMSPNVIEWNMAAVIFTSEALLLSMVLNEYIAEQTKMKKTSNVTTITNSTVAKHTSDAANDQEACDTVSHHPWQNVLQNSDSTDNTCITSTTTSTTTKAKTRGESKKTVSDENVDEYSTGQQDFSKLRKVQPISLELLIRL